MRASSLAIGICCGPFICVYVSFAACFCPGKLRRSFEPEEKKRFERRQKNAPRPLAIRNRELTIPLPDNVRCPRPKQKQQTLDQFQSRLMNLPLELREMVYRHVLGDKTMHVILKEKKLGHLRCRATTEEGCPVTGGTNNLGPVQGRCWGHTDSANIWVPVPNLCEKTDGDIIPFLRSCRQIYSESINFLYSTNTFSFTDLDCLRHFIGKTIPSRRNLIQSLVLDWSLTWPMYDDIAQHLLLNNPALYPPNDESTWENTWQLIARMDGLKSLKVELLYFDGFRDKVIEAKTLEPLKQVTKVPDFVVHVSWPGEDLKDVPFKLIRPDENSDLFW